MGEELKMHRKVAYALFQKYDASGDGELGMDEIEGLVPLLNSDVGVDEQKAHAIFAKIREQIAKQVSAGGVTFEHFTTLLHSELNPCFTASPLAVCAEQSKFWWMLQAAKLFAQVDTHDIGEITLEQMEIRVLRKLSCLATDDVSKGMHVFRSVDKLFGGSQPALASSGFIDPMASAAGMLSPGSPAGSPPMVSGRRRPRAERAKLTDLLEWLAVLPLRDDDEAASSPGLQPTARKTMSKTESQKITFCRWANMVLTRGGFQDQLSDLEIDSGLAQFRDGIIPIKLMCVIASTKMPRYEKKIRDGRMGDTARLCNIGVALDLVKQAKVKLIGVGTHDILHQSESHVLAWLWRLIYEKQIGKIKFAGGDGDGESGSGEQGLLLWCRFACKKHGIEINNFTTSWSSGHALAALIIFYRVGIFKWEEVSSMEPQAMLELLMELSWTKLGIPRLMDVQQIIGASDKSAMMTYLYQFYALFMMQQKEEASAKVLRIFCRTQVAIGKLQLEYEEGCREVLSFCSDEIAEWRTIGDGELSLQEARDALDRLDEFRRGPLRSMRATRNNVDANLAAIHALIHAATDRRVYAPPKEYEMVGQRWDEVEEAVRAALLRLRGVFQVQRDILCKSLRGQITIILTRVVEARKAVREATSADGATKAADVLALVELITKCRATEDELRRVRVQPEEVDGVDAVSDDLDELLAMLRAELAKRLTVLDTADGATGSTSDSAHSKEVFDFFDRNGNGELSFDEFCGALAALGLHAKGDEEHSRVLWDKFQVGGVMTRSIFITVLIEVQGDKVTKEQVLAAIAKLKLNKDALPAVELAKHIGEPLANDVDGLAPKAGAGELDMGKYVDLSYKS